MVYAMIVVLLKGWGPPSASLADGIFAYGAIVLLVGLIVWNSRSNPDPP